MSRKDYDFDYKEITIFDRKNPDSLINILPAYMVKWVEGLDKRWFDYSQAMLKSKCHPSPREHQLRLAFWHEYSQAQEHSRKMKAENIYGPICTKDYFYRVIVKTPSKLAWLLNTPPEYQIQIEEMLHLGLGKLRDVLELPITDSKGPNTRLISEMVKIVALLDNRVKGAVVQRMSISQQNLNLNVDGKVPGPQSPKTVTELNRELSQIQREIRQIESPYKKDLIKELNGTKSESEVIDAEATPVGAGASETR